MKGRILTAALALSVVMISGLVGADTAKAITLNDGYMTYVATPAGQYAGNMFFDVLVVDPYGDRTNGCLFYDPSWQSFKICAFENDLFWGWTIEGHWGGAGSLGFQAINTGYFGEVEIGVGPASAPAKNASDARCK